MTDTEKIKTHLLDYLTRKGHDVKTGINPPNMRCPNPMHADNNPSAVVYQTSRGDKTDTVYCPVCHENWDVFEVAAFDTGRSTKTDFPYIKSYICDIIGVPMENNIPSKPAPSVPKPVPLDLEAARKIYTRENAQSLANRMQGGKGVGTYVKAWPYIKDGKVICSDIRFETEDGKKSVITMYYNGRNLVSKGYPIAVYNYDNIKEGKPVVIHEGAKSASTAQEALPGFTHITWNGGAKKVNQIDWSFLSQNIVYLLPDDDQKKDRDGKLINFTDQPGYAAMSYIYHQIKNKSTAKIVPPYLPSRQIKPDGADIVEHLQAGSPEEIESHILNSANNIPKGPTTEKKEDDDDFPFKVLGIADDGKAYFIDGHQRLHSAALDKITKGKMLSLASLQFWQTYFSDGTMKQEAWDSATDALIRTSADKDFDPDNLRGRGAWRERDGRICYHDGDTTIGEHDEKRIFLRKIKHDIGLCDNPIDRETTGEIIQTVEQMTFETAADAMRCLAWSILSPFSGALPIRPAGLLTGDSGTGKTAILDSVIKPIAAPFIANAQESSVAGIRQKINQDSCGIVLEEAEAGSESKNRKRDEFFSLMRVSFSDDAPDAYKGTQDQSGRSFKMKNMFLFISISSEVEEVADDKRIFRITLKPKKNDWRMIEKTLHRLLTERTCRAIRSSTWNALPSIIETAEQCAPIIKETTGLDTRSSMSEAILYAAHRIVWRGLSFDDTQVRQDIADLFSMQPVEDHRNDVEEMVDRLLSEVVMLPSSGGEKMSLRKMLTCLATGQIESDDDNDVRTHRHMKKAETRAMKQIVESYGIKWDENRQAVAICNSHHMIKKILNRGEGYHKMLWRHPNFIPDVDGAKSHSIYIDGTTKRAVLIDNLIDPSIDDLPF